MISTFLVSGCGQLLPKTLEVVHALKRNLEILTLEEGLIHRSSGDEYMC